jgi:hypothetical protein
VNPFYVEPAGNYQQALSGLGSVIGNYREEQKRLSRSETAKAAAAEAYKSGDPEKVAAASIEYPEIQQTLQSLYGFKNEQTKRNAMETYKEVLANKNNPQAALNAINSRISFVESQGGDPSSVTLRARDRLQSMLESGQDVSPFFKAAELEYAGIASPQEWKAYSGASQEDSPSSVKETEWFLKQSPKVQEEHLKLKRKTDPTMAEKLALEQARADIAVSEAGGKAMAADRIAAASEAADKVLSIEGGLGIYDRLAGEIDKGANTSVFTSWAPSISDATRRFEQGARELGLGVISNTTFGALSEGELRLAMETAVPKLQPAQMKQWLMDKKAVQQKLADEMFKYAEHLENGGTKVSWIKAQKELKKAHGGSGEGAATTGITGQTETAQPSIDDLLRMY